MHRRKCDKLFIKDELDDGLCQKLISGGWHKQLIQEACIVSAPTGPTNTPESEFLPPVATTVVTQSSDNPHNSETDTDENGAESNQLLRNRQSRSSRESRT